jgi:hypothetical protein
MRCSVGLGVHAMLMSNKVARVLYSHCRVFITYDGFSMHGAWPSPSRFNSIRLVALPSHVQTYSAWRH